MSAGLDLAREFGGIVEKPPPLTYGQANMPVYCVHAAVMTMLAMEHDVLYWFEEPSDKLGETPCKFYIYRDPEDVPSELYAKLGKSRPGGGQSARKRKD